VRCQMPSRSGTPDEPVPDWALTCGAAKTTNNANATLRAYLICWLPFADVRPKCGNHSAGTGACQTREPTLDCCVSTAHTPRWISPEPAVGGYSKSFSNRGPAIDCHADHFSRPLVRAVPAGWGGRLRCAARRTG